MKIVVNSRFLCQPLTGIQRFAIEISLYLKEWMKDDIVFVAPSSIQQKEIAQKLNVQIIGKYQGQIWEQIDLLKFLNKNGKPLLLCLSGGAPLFYKNLIFTLHDIVYIRYPQSYSLSYRLFYRFIIPRILKNAKKIITVSQFSKKEISEYYAVSQDKIKVIYNAVGSTFQTENTSLTINSKFGKYFLAVSSPAFHKNFEFLVRSFLKANLPEAFQLVIVGNLDSDLYKSNTMMTNLKKDNRVHILGRVDDADLIELYQNAMAFVFPSLYEGFGIPPLEAQACGCLVLSSNQASMPEVLNNSAIYFSPNDEDSLINSFNRVININDDEVNAFKLHSDINVKRFSWKKSAQEMTSILNEILSENNKSQIN